MAFLASNIIPEEGYKLAKKLALNTRNYLIGRNTEFLSDTNADVILATFHDLRRARDQFNVYKAIPGIAQYARDQEDDPLYDVAAEFNAMIAAFEAVMSQIFTSFPTDAGGFLLEKKLLPSGLYEYRVFTPAQLTTVRGLIDTAIASVI